ncbi:MAG: molybdopterin converting factor subunit 1 [Thermoplasmata archaeon]
MLLRVKYFARFREIAGLEEEDLEITSGSTVKDLKRSILSLHPGLSSYENTLIVARNEQFADDSVKVSQDDTIAVFPPVSGG